MQVTDTAPHRALRAGGTVRLMPAVLAAVLGACGESSPSTASTPAIIVRHATLLDGLEPRPQRDVAIVLRAGRIESVHPDREVESLDDTVIDVGGRWVVPGLIDAHAHLGIHQDISGEPDSIAAQRALDGGVTTLRSLSSIPGYADDIALRERFLAGDSRLPRTLAAGQWIIPIVNDDWLREFPGLRSMLAPATPADEALMLTPPPGWRLTGNVSAIDSAVAILGARGVDWLKVFATGRVGDPDSDPEMRLLTDSDLYAAVRAANRRGLPVAAHAHGDEGIRAAVLAGARTIEHGTWASDETLRLMRERGTCLVPTLSSWDFSLPSTDSVVLARNEALRTVAEDAVRRARSFGVPIIAGADNVYLEFSPRYSQELLALARVGLSPDEVLRAATSESAKCLGLADRTGSVTPGLEADLLVIEGDPLDDLTRLDKPVMVFVAGRLVVDRRTEAQPPPQ